MTMFKGLGQLGDMAKMMKAAQDMQQKMASLQEEMHNIMVEGRSGAGQWCGSKRGPCRPGSAQFAARAGL